MKLFKRVWISIIRRRVNTLVLLLVTFILGNTMFMALSIQQSSISIRDDMMQRIGGKLILTGNVTDYSAIQNMFESEYKRKMEEYIDIYSRLSRNERVEYSDIYYNYGGLTLINNEEYEINVVNFSSSFYSNALSILHGIGNSEMIDEKENILKMSSGSKFTEDQMNSGSNVMIVNEKLLRNGTPLKTGDIIEFEMKVTGFDSSYKQTVISSEIISYEIIGTFKTVDNKYSDIQKDVYMFYVPNNNIVNLSERYYQQVSGSSHMYMLGKGLMWIDSSLIKVYTPNDLLSLRNAAETITADTGVSFETSEDSVKELMGPIYTYAALGQNVLLFSITAMCLITGLISFYFMRDRKHEVGIYMSLGIKKAHLLSQIVLEMLLTGLLGVMLSVGSGWVLSQKYSDYLMNTVIQTEIEEKDKYITDFDFDDGDLEMRGQYKIKTDAHDVAFLFAISTGTLLVSCLFPLIYTMRLKPKNIMLE